MRGMPGCWCLWLRGEKERRQRGVRKSESDGGSFVWSEKVCSVMEWKREDAGWSWYGVVLVASAGEERERGGCAIEVEVGWWFSGSEVEEGNLGAAAGRKGKMMVRLKRRKRRQGCYLAEAGSGEVRLSGFTGEDESTRRERRLLLLKVRGGK
ncbi:hypothetical protein HAX54_034731 [Datura stramonium]|uniref:Uncharacterized protein n=1 Tax=Datura stramonium TaxID=4076 RepID=A0ABS8VHC3_DATST|nr:hypothetical protein [Datura stramonium]